MESKIYVAKSQNFEVWMAHPHNIYFEETSPAGSGLSKGSPKRTRFVLFCFVFCC